MRLEHSAECDKRKILKNISAENGQSAAETILNRSTHRGQAVKILGFAAAKFMLDICGKLWYNAFCNCGYSTSASISAFQAEEVGSIPITRSKKT